MRRRRPTTSNGVPPHARTPEFGTPASARYRKPNAPARRACFATSQGARVNGPGNQPPRRRGSPVIHQRGQKVMVKNILRFVGRFARADKAVSALEYAILVGVIVAGVGGALLAFSDNIETALTNIGAGVGATTTQSAPTITN